MTAGATTPRRHDPGATTPGATIPGATIPGATTPGSSTSRRRQLPAPPAPAATISVAS